MSYDFLTTGLQVVRGSDINSLLRWYDQANDLLHKSSSQQERARASKFIQCIARELRKRKAPL